MSGIAEVPFGADTIRASSLPTWNDCERRWVATAQRPLIRAAGYDLSSRETSIGAHVGSASHAGVARGWDGVQKAGEWSPLDECDDIAVETLRQREVEEGASYDRTTPDRNAAEGAARKIIRAYRGDVPAWRRPELIEAKLAARIRDGWYLTGHTDLFTEPDRACEDLKTGVRPPEPIHQIGAYSLMLVASGRPVNKARMTWVRRVGQKTEQPPPMTVGYDVGLAMRLARTAVGDISAKVDRFRNATAPDPLLFRANPSSVLCGAKYCPAFGSAFCPESHAKKGMSDDD